jgi:nucleotide-binding universal stress UspA family protein
MAYKDLVVLLDAEPATRDRIELAAAMASRFGAHLVGLYAEIVPELPRRHGYFDPALLDPLYREVEATSRERAREMRDIFEGIAAQHALSAEWRFAIGDPSEIAVLHGRYSDLIIAGQIDPEDKKALLSRPHPEEVALAVGRPVLVIPYAGRFDRVGQRVIVGWDASREATRAISDALPLLTEAQSVTVIAVDPEVRPDGHGEIPGADIALHLARHGIKATIERTISGGIGPGNALLSRASDLGADLLVIGAYGHSRVRELLLGGVTRTILSSMTIPVLMSH